MRRIPTNCMKTTNPTYALRGAIVRNSGSQTFLWKRNFSPGPASILERTSVCQRDEPTVCSVLLQYGPLRVRVQR